MSGISGWMINCVVLSALQCVVPITWDSRWSSQAELFQASSLSLRVQTGTNVDSHNLISGLDQIRLLQLLSIPLIRMAGLEAVTIQPGMSTMSGISGWMINCVVLSALRCVVPITWDSRWSSQAELFQASSLSLRVQTSTNVDSHNLISGLDQICLLQLLSIPLIRTAGLEARHNSA